MDFTRKLSFLVFVLCVVISLKNQNAETNKGSPTVSWASSDSSWPTFLVQEADVPQSLEYNFYRQSCPQAEQIIRSTVRSLYKARPHVVPALLRLVFHDCFVEGCDGSVLLDDADGIESEKETPPNETLKGFDLIDTIKSELEQVCPGIVSCADILVLAARETVILAGGPFYPLLTGRRDGTLSFAEVATFELPSPLDDLSRTVSLFAARGFDERETVSLLGAHSTGMVHCKFFLNRLYNFSGTNEPDPSMDIEFLNLLRSRCNNTRTSSSLSLASPSLAPSSSSSINGSPSSSPQETGMKMDFEGPGSGFGTLYYRSLLQGRGVLYVDQQLTVGEETETWVRAYASDVSLFRRDFASTMIKLSSYRVLTGSTGQVRLNCRKVV